MDKDLAKMNEILSTQMDGFIRAMAPYLSASEDAEGLVDRNSAEYLRNLTFLRLASCTMEDMEDPAAFLQGKFEKLFTALHPLGSPIVYGIVSRGGKASLVIGVNASVSGAIVKPVLQGLLAGMELEECAFDFSASLGREGRGGFLCAVPVLKTDEGKQKFDLSALMRSLNGEAYTILFYAKPVPAKLAQEKYTAVMRIRDVCAAVGKRNISAQKATNQTRTVTKNATRRGLVQEALGQIVRDQKVDGRALIDAVIDGGNLSYSISDAETLKSLTTGISYDMHNGMALEMAGLCDRAIERLKFGQGTGLWSVAISYAACGAACDILEACICGELARPTADLLPLRRIPYRLEDGQSVYLPNDSEDNPLLTPLTSAELGMVCTPPADIVPDFARKRGKAYPLIPLGGGIEIGKVMDGYRPLPNMAFALSEEDLNRHTFLCGITGSGKTTTVKGILASCNKPFWVIESAKKEYRNLSLPDGQSLCVYTMGKPEINCLQFNPFYVQRGVSLQTHIDYLKDLFNASFSFYGPMTYILEKCLHNIYQKKGWNQTLGYHPYLINLKSATDVFDSEYMRRRYEMKSSCFLFPTMQDLKDEVKRYIENEMKYEGDVGSNIKAAILARLESLCVGSKGYMFNTRRCMDMDSLMEQKAVFELEGLADDADKAFCVGLLIIFINEFRQVYQDEHANEKSGLRHLLVIEEAHRLLKNMETERVSENMGNPKGKAVEHFTNMLAEMRSYGQGVIIAEQIPCKLAPDAIKNSSNKIIQRLVSADDQRLAANAIGMKEEEAVYLGSLKKWEALCHKEGMSLPVHVAVHPVEDQHVSDSDLIAGAMDAIFAKINDRMTCEKLGKIQDSVSLKLLNTLLALDEGAIEKAVKRSKEQMERELERADVSLLPGKASELFGNILADWLLSLLCGSIYGFGSLADDELYEAVHRLCVTGRTEYVKQVKEKLSSLYGRDTGNHCKLILCELLKNRYSSVVNLEASIRAYFFEVPASLVNEIGMRIKGGDE